MNKFCLCRKTKAPCCTRYCGTAARRMQSSSSPSSTRFPSRAARARESLCLCGCLRKMLPSKASKGGKASVAPYLLPVFRTLCVCVCVWSVSICGSVCWHDDDDDGTTVIDAIQPGWLTSGWGSSRLKRFSLSSQWTRLFPPLPALSPF